jgi:hypothetical protein
MCRAEGYRSADLMMRSCCGDKRKKSSEKFAEQRKAMIYLIRLTKKIVFERELQFRAHGIEPNP